MSDYTWRRKLNEAESKIKILKGDIAKWSKLFQGVGNRVDLDGRIVEALFLDALQSDNEGLQKQVADLLMMTKLIHPEKAHKVSQTIKAEKAAEQHRIQMAKERDEQRRKEEAAFDAKVRKVIDQNIKIERENLKTAQSMVDAIYDRLKDGASQASLNSEEHKLIGQLQKHETHFKIQHYGILWGNLRWVGAPLKFTDLDHPVAKFLMQDRSLSFKQPQPMPEQPRRLSPYSIDIFDIGDNWFD